MIQINKMKRMKEIMKRAFSSPTIRLYKVTLNGEMIPLHVGIGDQTIFISSEKKEDAHDYDKACIEMHVDEDGYQSKKRMLLNSYFDEPLSKCDTTRTIPHSKLFDLLKIVSYLVGVTHMELVDGSRIKMGKCNWNLRILHRLKQMIEKKTVRTFYEKYGFQPYKDVLKHVIHNNKIPELKSLYLHMTKEDKDIVDSFVESYDIKTTEQFIETMYSLCSGEQEYEEDEYTKVEKIFIYALTKLYDVEEVRVGQIYYYDVPKLNIQEFSIHRSSGAIGEINIHCNMEIQTKSRSSLRRTRRL
jgi:hypothetical protein